MKIDGMTGGKYETEAEIYLDGDDIYINGNKVSSTPELPAVAIPVKEYKRLKACERVLNALEAGGVSDWEWYEASLENMEDED